MAVLYRPVSLSSEYSGLGMANVPLGSRVDDMARIFETTNHLQIARNDKASSEPAGKERTEVPDRRRSRRWPLDIPVYVYGHGPGKEPFHEEAHTLHVSANGALLLLSVPVQEGQKLLLTNSLTQKEQDCLVVFIGTRHTRTVEAGIAFPLANAAFWQLPTAS